MQMGYEPGKGLGKSLQGRSAPVEAAIRKGRGAIGAYGAEHKPAKSVDSEDGEQKEFQKGLSQWRKAVGVTKWNKKDKIRYTYHTTEEVVEEISKGGVRKMARKYSEISKTKVIGMTGRERRVLSGYSALAAKKTTEPEDVETVNLTAKAIDRQQLNKLAYNLDALVDYCEREIIQNAQELSRNHDQLSAFEDEIKAMSSVVIRDEKQIESLSSVLQLLEQMDARRKTDELDMDYLSEQFRHLERNHGDDYIKNDMANVALAYLVPLVKDRLATFWRPFESGVSSNENCRRMLFPWRSLFKNQTRHTKANVMEPYGGLVWNGWMPALRGLIGQWRCKEAESMVDLLDRWEPLLPEWIMDNILVQLILPRIQSQVDAWNPLTDPFPIHAWIHPWLSRLSARLELVYPTIRQKMAQALVTWRPRTNPPVPFSCHGCQFSPRGLWTPSPFNKMGSWITIPS